MAILKYKDDQGNWQLLDSGGGSGIDSVETELLPFGSVPQGAITGGTLYVKFPGPQPVDNAVSSSSENPVQNKVIYNKLLELTTPATVAETKSYLGIS